MPRIDYKIDLGHLITLAILVVSGAVAYGRIDAKLNYLQEQVAHMQGLGERMVRVETLLQEGHRGR